ncbi:MAG TPA: hypothetical protein VKA97_08930 [Pyrinomonadaceae bacterium]|nr:hypothetical protein [Pyrinomonadaceae bacterium]
MDYLCPVFRIDRDAPRIVIWTWAMTVHTGETSNNMSPVRFCEELDRTRDNYLRGWVREVISCSV